MDIRGTTLDRVLVDLPVNCLTELFEHNHVIAFVTKLSSEYLSLAVRTLFVADILFDSRVDDVNDDLV